MAMDRGAALAHALEPGTGELSPQAFSPTTRRAAGPFSECAWRKVSTGRTLVSIGTSGREVAWASTVRSDLIPRTSIE